MQKIKINNKKYKISFNFGVIKGVCKECKCTTPEMIARLSEGDLDVISSILYHGIKFNHPEFEQSEVPPVKDNEVLVKIHAVSLQVRSVRGTFLLNICQLILSCIPVS